MGLSEIACRDRPFAACGKPNLRRRLAQVGSQRRASRAMSSGGRTDCLAVALKLFPVPSQPLAQLADAPLT